MLIGAIRNGATKRRHLMQITIHEVREPYGSDWYVYAGSKLVRVCPSLGMAREVAAGLGGAA